MYLFYYHCVLHYKIKYLSNYRYFSTNKQITIFKILTMQTVGSLFSNLNIESKCVYGNFNTTF